MGISIRILMGSFIIFYCFSSYAAFNEKNAPKSTYKAGKWSPWSLSGFSIASIDAEEASQPLPGSVFTYNYISLNYKMSSDRKISFRPAFIYETEGHDRRGRFLKQDVKLADASISFSNYDLALLPGNVGLSAQARFYFPTSEGSQEKSRAGTLGSWVTLSKPVSVLSDFSYHMKPKYYLNREKTYTRVYPSGWSTIRQNKELSLEHYLEFTHRVTKDFSIQTSLKHYYETYLSSKSDKKDFFYRENAGLAVGFDYNATDKVRFIFIVEQKRNAKNPRDSFQLFKEEETSYALLTFLRLGYL